MLSYKDYLLKSLDESYLELILDWRNSIDIRQMMYSDHLITLEEHMKWYETVQEKGSSRVKLLFYQDIPIGLVKFSQFDKQSNTCYWGFYIGDQSAPKGSGSIMGYLALTYIFETYGIRKLCSEIMDFNVASIYYHEKLGFVEEGRFKKHVLKNGSYVDVIAMSLFKENWLAIKPKLYLNIGGM